MTKRTQKQIGLLTAKLEILQISKEIASDNGDEKSFDGIIKMIHDIEAAIVDLSRPNFRGCAVSKALINANVD